MSIFFNRLYAERTRVITMQRPNNRMREFQMSTQTDIFPFIANAKPTRDKHNEPADDYLKAKSPTIQTSKRRRQQQQQQQHNDDIEQYKSDNNNKLIKNNE